MGVILEAKSLEKTLHRFVNFKWETKKPAKNVSLYVKEREILGILGPNGAGKSTTLKMITGDITPDSGCVIFDGKDITSWPMYKRCSAGLGYMAQDNTLFRQMTVENNLIGIMQMQGFTQQECRARCEELMELFNLKHLRNNLAANISGGEKRRLEVARVLTRRPKLLILDEPFPGVDPIVTKMIIDLVIDLWQNWGIAIIVTDHDYRRIAQMVERCYVIFNGEVVFNGTPEEMVNNEFVQQIYLGKDEEEIITVDKSGYRRVKSLHDSLNKSNLETSISQNASQISSSVPTNSQSGAERESSLKSENSVTQQFVSENVCEADQPEQTAADSELSELLQPVQTNEFQTNELDNKPSATLADFIQNNESDLELFQPQPPQDHSQETSSQQTSDQTNSQRQRKFPLSGPTIKPFRRKK